MTKFCSQETGCGGLRHATVILPWEAFPQGGSWPWQGAPLCSGSWDTRVRGPGQLLADIGRNNGMSRYSPQTLAWEGSHLRGQSQIYNPGWRTSTSGRGGGSQRRRNTPYTQSQRSHPWREKSSWPPSSTLHSEGIPQRQEETRNPYCWERVRL